MKIKGLKTEMDGAIFGHDDAKKKIFGPTILAGFNNWFIRNSINFSDFKSQ